MFCKLSTIIAPCEVTTKSGLDQNEIVLKTVKFAPFYEVIMDNDANKRGQPQIPITNKNIPERSLRVFRRDPSRHTLKVLAQNGPNDLTTSTSSPSSGSGIVPDIDYSSSSPSHAELTPHVSTRDMVNPYQDEGVVYHTKRVKTGSSRSSRDHFDVTYSSPPSGGYRLTSSSALGPMMVDESVAAAAAAGGTKNMALTPSQRRLLSMESSGNFGTNAGGAAAATGGLETMTMNTPRSARGSSGVLVGGQNNHTASSGSTTTTATLAETSYGLSTPSSTSIMRPQQQPLYSTTQQQQQQQQSQQNAPSSLYPFRLNTRIEGAAPSANGIGGEMWEPSQWIGSGSSGTFTHNHMNTNTSTNSGNNNKPPSMWECGVGGGGRELGEYANIATELDNNSTVVLDNSDELSASREETGTSETPIIMQEDSTILRARKYTGCVGTQWCMGETSTTILIPTSPMHNSSTMVRLLGTEAKAKNGSDANGLCHSSWSCMRPGQGCYGTTHEGYRDVSLTLALEPCPSNQFTSHMNTTSFDHTESTSDHQQQQPQAKDEMPHDDLYENLDDTYPRPSQFTTTTPWVLGERLHKQFNLGKVALAPHMGSFRSSSSTGSNSGPGASGKTLYVSEENLKHPAEEAFPQLPRVNTGLMFGLRTKNNESLNVHNKNVNPSKNGHKINGPFMSTSTGDSTSVGNNATHSSHKQLHTAAAPWAGGGGGGGSPIWSRMNPNIMGTSTPAGAGAGNMSSTSTTVNAANKYTATTASVGVVPPLSCGVAHDGGGGARIGTELDHVPLQTDFDSPPAARFRSNLQIKKGDSEIEAARAVTGAWGCYR